MGVRMMRNDDDDDDDDAHEQNYEVSKVSGVFAAPIFHRRNTQSVGNKIHTTTP